jgi:hypothetical protein
MAKYRPPFGVVFSGRNLGSDPRSARCHYPLYLAGKFPLASPTATAPTVPGAPP